MGVKEKYGVSIEPANVYFGEGPFDATLPVSLLSLSVSLSPPPFYISLRPQPTLCACVCMRTAVAVVCRSLECDRIDRRGARREETEVGTDSSNMRVCGGGRENESEIACVLIAVCFLEAACRGRQRLHTSFCLCACVCVCACAPQ